MTIGGFPEGCQCHIQYCQYVGLDVDNDYYVRCHNGVTRDTSGMADGV